MLYEVLFSLLKTDKRLIQLFHGKIKVSLPAGNNTIQTKNYEIETIYIRSDFGIVPVSLLK